MTTPVVLKRLLNRLPEFYKQEGTYNEGGFTEIGHLFYNDVDESGTFISPDLEISTEGCYLEVDLIIAGHTNYKFGTVLVQEEKRIASVISEVIEAHQIDNVSGINLDRLAKIFDLSRGDWSDDDLRAFLGSAVSGLIGGGTTPNLRTAVALITGIPEANIIITDAEAACFVVEVPKKYATPELTTMITKYKPAGVSFSLVYGEGCKWDTGKWDECVWV